jgi:hypothetical protein
MDGLLDRMRGNRMQLTWQQLIGLGTPVTSGGAHPDAEAFVLSFNLVEIHSRIAYSTGPLQLRRALFPHIHSSQPGWLVLSRISDILFLKYQNGGVSPVRLVVQPGVIVGDEWLSLLRTSYRSLSGRQLLR